MLAALALVALQNPRLDAVLDSPELSGAIVCASVVDLDGNVLYERNSSLRVLPASSYKSFTCAYALWSLGPKWRPQTRIWKGRTRTVVESDGDPLLSRQQLRAVAKRLRLNRSFPVAVKQAYRPQIPPTWEWDDLPYRYGGRITSFTVDRGGCEFWSDGKKLFLKPEPKALWLRWKKTDAPLEYRYDLKTGVVEAIGKAPAKVGKIDAFAYAQPDREAALELGKRLTTLENAPPQAPDAVIDGSPLQEILPACLVPSDNNVAENLLLLATKKEGPLPAEKPYPLATKRLTDFLEKVVGIQPNDVLTADGCGMSRQDATTTRALVKLYAWAAKQPTADIWKASLPNPAKGTMIGRLAGVEFTGKTGTLTRVSSLTGYVRTKSGKEAIACVILNNFTCASKVAKGIEERFIREIVDAVP